MATNETTETGLAMNLHFTPLLEPAWLWGVIGLGAVLLCLSAFQYRRGLVTRTLTFLIFVLALCNPSILTEERNYVKDVAVLVLDESASQNFGQRAARSKQAVDYLKHEIDQTGAFELRVIQAPKNGALSNRTDLFSALDQTLNDVPQKRRAGVIFITDGQVHDVPSGETAFTQYGPVHTLLSGTRQEKDRQIAITNAPAYGLVGKNVDISYRINDTDTITQSHAEVTLTLHDGTKRTDYVPVNQKHTITVPLQHASENVFTLSVEGVEDEITYANNKTALLINGVRDRLKVLLVSGVPYSGERTWRDLLTSDPGVDLVHFTILREPQKYDYTPKSEMSLIAFPFRELFEVKLYDFDLIIFDRYRVNNILPDIYFENIANYVREGGAFLESSGPAFAEGRRSVYNTPLGRILPAAPSGNVVEQKYTPAMTQMGHNHPVTESLVWNKTANSPDTQTPWGSWLRYIDIKTRRGDTLMTGPQNNPLLVLDRVGDGRVAQLSSDHIWLWSRGYDGGGPHAELLRRIVHWLMKEPELDERALDVTVRKNAITIEKQAFGKNEETLSLNLPNGDITTITLKNNGQGKLSATHTAQSLGVYAFEDVNGTRKFAIVGDTNPPELDGVVTTEDKMAPVVNASSGTLIWLEEEPQPTLSTRAQARRYGGNDWLALKRNNDYTVTGVRDTPILPEWVMMLMLFSALILLWWREGRASS